MLKGILVCIYVIIKQGSVCEINIKVGFFLKG